MYLGLIQKQKVDINGENSTQISNVAKNGNTKMTLNYDYGSK